MISIDYTLIIVILNFVVLLFILNQLLYKPISKFLSDRKAKIALDIKETKQAKLDAEEFVVQKQNELKNTSEEIRTLKKSALQEAKQNATKIVEDARTRERTILSEAEVQLKHEKEKVVSQIKEDLAEMVSGLAEKFLSKKIDSATDKKLIETMLERGTSEK